MYVQPLDGQLTTNALAAPAGGMETEGSLFGGVAAPTAGDNISRFVPPWSNEGAGTAYGDAYGSSSSMQGMFGPLMGVLQQLMQMLQSLMRYGCNPQPASGNCSDRFFQNASGSSDGDPHLSFNGQKWNNMASQPDLINSDSFAGGFRVSTQVTPQNGKGVTWNQSATVSMNNGATTVSMNDNGQASITNNGQRMSISRGQTLQLGDGESVTYEQNGALRVCAENGHGGQIETTLSPQGKGVNVDITAHDVDLGGALVNGPQAQFGPTPPGWGPVMGPISGQPIMGPFPIQPPPITQPPPIMQSEDAM